MATSVNVTLNLDTIAKQIEQAHKGSIPLGPNFELVQGGNQRAYFGDLIFEVQCVFYRQKSVTPEEAQEKIQKAIAVVHLLKNFAKKLKFPEEYEQMAKNAISHLNCIKGCKNKKEIAQLLRENLSLLVVAKKHLFLDAKEAYYSLQVASMPSVEGHRRRKPDGTMKFRWSSEVTNLFLSSSAAIAFFCKWTTERRESSNKVISFKNPLSDEEMELVKAARMSDDQGLSRVATSYYSYLTYCRMSLCCQNIKRAEQMIDSISQERNYPFFHDYFPLYQEFLERSWGPRCKAKKVFCKDAAARLEFYGKYVTSFHKTLLVYNHFYKDLVALSRSSGTNQTLEDYSQCLYPVEGIVSPTLPTSGEFGAERIVEIENAAREKIPEKSREESPPPPETKGKKKRRKKKNPSPPFNTPPLPSLRARPIEQPISSQAVEISTAPTPSQPPAQARAPEGREGKEGKAVPFLDGLREEQDPAYRTIRYDDRVLDWLENGGAAALSGPEYRDLTRHQQRAALERHAFPIALDRFVGTRYSRTSTWENSTTGHADPCVMIPCVQEERLSSGQTKETRIVLGYTFGSDGLCYHRCSTIKTPKEFADEIMTRTFQHDFPSLAESARQATTQSRPFVQQVDDAEVEVDPLIGMATVHDRQNNRSFKLFKFG